MAKCLEVTPAMVNQWVKGLRPIPLDRCAQIEKATGGAVTCEALRPDKAEYFGYMRSVATPSKTERRKPATA